MIIGDSEFPNIDSDIIYGGTRSDWIDGGTGNDRLWGNNGADRMVGGSGYDLLNGGIGADDLTGGLNRDTFVFKVVSDSQFAAFDHIFDFDGASEKIDLWFTVAGVDVPITAHNLNALTVVLDPAHLASHHAVVATLANGNHFLVVDANGRAGYQENGDLLIQLDGTHLTAISPRRSSNILWSALTARIAQATLEQIMNRMEAGMARIGP